MLDVALTCSPLLAAARVHNRDRAPGAEVQRAGVEGRQARHPLVRPGMHSFTFPCA